MKALALPRPIFRPSKKLVMIVVACIVWAVALGLGGYWLTSNQLANDYSAKVSAITDEIKQTLTDSAAKFKAASDAGDSSTVSQLLADLSQTLETKLNALPSEPNILGYRLVSESLHKPKEDLQTRTSSLIEVLNDTKDLVDYQKSVLAALQTVKDLTGKNQAEQETLASKWSELVATLEAMQPPLPAAAVHSELIEAAKAAQAVIAGFPDLYKAKNQSGFLAKQRELDNKIEDITALSDDYGAIAQTQDVLLTKAYAELQRVLR